MRPSWWRPRPSSLAGVSCAPSMPSYSPARGRVCSRRRSPLPAVPLTPRHPLRRGRLPDHILGVVREGGVKAACHAMTPGRARIRFPAGGLEKGLPDSRIHVRARRRDCRLSQRRAPQPWSQSSTGGVSCLPVGTPAVAASASRSKRRCIDNLAAVECYWRG